MRIFQEEVFGPFTSVTPFKDEATPCGLPMTHPLGSRPRSAPATSAARIGSPRGQGRHRWINDHHRLDPASPWGGVDDSVSDANAAPKVLTIISTQERDGRNARPAIRLVPRHGKPATPELNNNRQRRPAKPY